MYLITLEAMLYHVWVCEDADCCTWCVIKCDVYDVRMIRDLEIEFMWHLIIVHYVQILVLQFYPQTNYICDFQTKIKILRFFSYSEVLIWGNLNENVRIDRVCEVSWVGVVAGEELMNLKSSGLLLFIRSFWLMKQICEKRGILSMNFSKEVWFVMWLFNRVAVKGNETLLRYPVPIFAINEFIRSFHKLNLIKIHLRCTMAIGRVVWTRNIWQFWRHRNEHSGWKCYKWLIKLYPVSNILLFYVILKFFSPF